MRPSARSSRGCATRASGRAGASAPGCTRSATWTTRPCRASSSSTTRCSANRRRCGSRVARGPSATASGEAAGAVGAVTDTMTGAYLPGGRRVELRDVPVPVPGHRQVLIAMRASSICGSDLRAIYREHLGTGPEAYQGVIGGHEPAGEIVEVGPGCRRFRVGDRVALYHIAGCGVCRDCRAGYMISCTSPVRAAYGWQRDGGHADYLLAEESTCIRLPDSLTFLDGACVACGFGTAYEAVCRAGVSGRDAVLVTGLGPVGLAVAMLSKALGSRQVIGVDAAPERL